MADYSCYIAIYNNTPYTLTLSGQGQDWGYWAVSPPATIPPFRATPEFQLKDSAGHNGTEGFVAYTANSVAADVFRISFCCPYYGANYCDVSNPNRTSFNVSFFAKSETAEQNNFCPRAGFPLHMAFSIATFV
jgi:hypothetical protein